MNDLKSTKPKNAGNTLPKHSSITIVLKDCPAQYRLAREAFEAEFLRAKLDKYAGNVSRTARALGVSRKTLVLKINRFGIDMKVLRGITSDTQTDYSGKYSEYSISTSDVQAESI
jgi:DNA-binding NtrC family response regulator